MMKNKAVLFDLDDTLYLEKDYVFSGFEAVAEYLGNEHNISKKEVLNELKSGFQRGIRGDNFDRMLENLNINADVEKLVKIYRHHDAEINLPQDSKNCLESLEEYKIGIITDGIEAKQKKKIEALNLSKFADLILISDEYGKDKRKPSGFMFEKAMEELKVQAADCVYIGDNPQKDFKFPNRRGMTTIRIIRDEGENSEKQPQKPIQQPDIVLENLKKLPKTINDIL